MIKLIGKFLIFAFFLNINKQLCSQEILKKYDMLPLSNDKSIYEFSIKNYNKSNPFSDIINGNSINFIKPNEIVSYNFGLLNRGNFDKTLNLSYSQNNFNRKSHPKKIDLSDFKISFKFLNILDSGKMDWRLFTGFRYQVLEKIEFNCYEGKNFVISRVNTSCSSNSKKEYKINDNEKLIDIQGNLIGTKFGLRKLFENWDAKNIIEFGINNNLIDYKLFFNSEFNKNNLVYRDSFPQDAPWIVNNFYSSFRHSRKLNDNWALGGAFSIYKNIKQNFSNSSEDISISDNKILDIHLTRRIGNDFYFGFGGYYSSNYLIGIEPIYYFRGNTNIFNNDYSEITIKFGYIKNEHFEGLTNYKNELDELFIENVSKSSNKKTANHKSFKKSTKAKSQEKKLFKNKLEIVNLDLVTYALEFAKKNDLSLQELLD